MAGVMTYAVLLREAGRPNAEAVRRAFRAFQHLTDADAVRLAANAQGILMRHLGVDEAKALQQALVAEGVSAALVKDDELRFLPTSRQWHRIELTDAALLSFDYLGAPTTVAWQDISLLAAGAVSHVEISAAPAMRPRSGLRTWLGLDPRSATETRSHLETGHQLILELVVGAGAARYEIQAQQFQFQSVLGPSAAPLVEKFVWLVREMSWRAPQAMLNRAAQDIRDGVSLVRGYPSRQSLLDEMVWLLWSARHRPAQS